MRFTVAYDGTSYHGFQDQGATISTIQAQIEKAILQISGESRRITGAGRTDAGVHASGQVFNVNTDAAIPLERWPFALNAVLPRDIVINEAVEVPTDFHARFSAVGKTYRYTVDNGLFCDVFQRRYAYHVRERLDDNLMQAVGAELVGKHDFSAFHSTGSSAGTTVRTLTQLDITRNGRLLQFQVSADGFLYNMVRIIVGTLLEVGRGKRTPSAVREALQTGQRELAGVTAPPHGLCLVRVHYPGE